MGFAEDLKLSDTYEKLTIELYKMKNYERKNYYFKEYDIIDNDTGIKYEVKSDRMTAKTNNIMIEYECNNKPSGITSTEADYYIYYVLNNDTQNYGYYDIPVSKIKKYIKENRYQRIIHGGYENRVKGYLFNTNAFEKYLIKDWKAPT